MPLPQAEVLSVEDICVYLGYHTKQKPKRQHDLTLSTREWRESYISSDGIPGREITDWISTKGNGDLKVMSQKFLECHGARHWPPGNGGLEYMRDEKKLLGLLHQLFWRQNLAAKNNQINKEKREAVKQNRNRETSSQVVSDNIGADFKAINAQSRYKSDHNADVHGYPRGDTTHPSDLSRELRPSSTGKGAYVGLSTDSEEEQNQRRPSLIFERKFVLNLAQYQDLYAAFSTTCSAPVANMVRKPAEPIVPSNFTRQERKSSLGDTHSTTTASSWENEISDSDSEPIVFRRALTRRENASRSARNRGENEELDKMRRRRSSRIRTLIGTTEDKDDTTSTSQTSPESESSASKSPIDDSVNDSRGKNSAEHGPIGISQIGRRSSNRKRTFSQESIEIPLSAKRPRRKSTMLEHDWPSTPASSIEFELHPDGKTAPIPLVPSSGAVTGESRDLDNVYPSPMDTQAETPDQDADSQSESLRQAKGTDMYRSNEAPPKQVSTSLSPTCRKCKQLRNICNGKKPCHCCKSKHRACVYNDSLTSKALQISSQHSGPSEPTRGTFSQDMPLLHSTNPTSPTQRSPLNPTPKPKSVSYYILASDATSSFEEPWSGPPLSEMTVQTLFTHASTHTCGRGVLKIKFTLGSSQPGFVGRKNVVGKDDAARLDEVKERFKIGRREGLKKGFSKFSILLEPELGAQTAVEEEEDVEVDDICGVLELGAESFGKSEKAVACLACYKWQVLALLLALRRAK